MTCQFVQRALKRLLANGPMIAVPKRPADQELLGLLAAARLAPKRTYTERETNEVLAAWLATFSEPCGIDHVTLRRMLVDMRLLTRTSSGSMYRLNPAKAGELDDLREIDLGRVLADVRAGREQRKRQHAGRG